jgi:hypothetical protein
MSMPRARGVAVVLAVIGIIVIPPAFLAGLSVPVSQKAIQNDLSSVGRKVALKCARAGHHFRLSSETRAAAKVSHFNVCKIHDIHTLSTPEGDRDCHAGKPGHP